MLDRDDVLFKGALERVILGILHGDEAKPGLIHSIRASQNWDTFQRVAGRIEGLELILQEMQVLARKMNGDARDRQDERMIN